MTNKELVHKITNDNYGLVLYKKPSDSNLSITFGRIKELNTISELSDKKGFLFHPFDVSNQKAVFIDSENQLDFKDLSVKNIISRLRKNFRKKHPQIGFEEYTQKVKSIMDLIRSNKLDKAILSIQKAEQLEIDYEYFMKGSSEVFRYIFLKADTGWIGASPEKFLSKNEKEIHTHSLAGTRKKSENNFWAEKESKEQEIVTTAIKYVFRNHSIEDLEISLQKKLTFGNIEHILNRIKGSITNKTQLFSLLNDLHPTPAVGTFPLKNSIDTIKKFEESSRNFYTGYFGIWNNKNDFDFYVNLRCLEILPNEFLFYAGGGITKDSIPLLEWEEANRKIEAFKQYLIEK